MQNDNEKLMEFQVTEQVEQAEAKHDYELIRAYADQLNGEVEDSEE
ncbi:hypothetical protein GQF01_32285 [Paenibacillus sp. 5J-6]|uniref:Uncharacterized protein n=1 Tax=Paenibacillus silvestris TaxID=2606219 RepID=A0A6L8V927_9BACL|nr:hypothetical protein [Paenibacillus silvestris]MZQ86797.1 hypothetical protein [Paenibacillus silvestris]